MTQALDAIDRALAASHGKDSSREEQDVALVTVETLQEVPGGLGRCGQLGFSLRPLRVRHLVRDTCVY